MVCWPCRAVMQHDKLQAAMAMGSLVCSRSQDTQPASSAWQGHQCRLRVHVTVQKDALAELVEGYGRALVTSTTAPAALLHNPLAPARGLPALPLAAGLSTGRCHRARMLALCIPACCSAPQASGGAATM